MSTPRQQPFRPPQASGEAPDGIAHGPTAGGQVTPGYPPEALRPIPDNVRTRKGALRHSAFAYTTILILTCHRRLRSSKPTGRLLARIERLDRLHPPQKWVLNGGIERAEGTGPDGEKDWRSWSPRLGDLDENEPLWIACKCEREHLVNVKELRRRALIGEAASEAPTPDVGLLHGLLD